MPPNVIICDWNGTLIRYRDESRILETVAVDVFRASLPFHPLKAARILRARRRIEDLHRDGPRDPELDYVRELFRIYNEMIIRGTPVGTILSSVEDYARRPQTLAKLDRRLLRSIRECREAGKTAGILSAGYRHGIQRILAAAGLETYFSFCEAEGLSESNGRAVGFELSIYKRKAERLGELLKDMGLDPGEVAYIGDSEDDAGCFETVGYPVISFFAPAEIKENLARSVRAFVPRDSEELTAYLLGTRRA